MPRESPAYRDLSDWVVLKVLDAIKGGVIKPGERLVERDVAERFGVSRAPVRDAIHKLEKLGVVERNSSRVACVRSWTDADVAEVLLLLDALILLSVQLAVDRLQPADIAELEEIVRATREAVAAGSEDGARQLALDRKFHAVIARASGHGRLIEMIHSLFVTWLELHERGFLASIGSAYSLREHTELLEALQQRDLDGAVSCVLRNARQSQAGLLKALQKRIPSVGVGMGGQ